MGYFGSNASVNGDMKVEGSQSSRCQWRSRGMSFVVKFKMLEGIVVSLVLYGSEWWILNSKKSRSVWYETYKGGSRTESRISK